MTTVVLAFFLSLSILANKRCKSLVMLQAITQTICFHNEDRLWLLLFDLSRINSPEVINIFAVSLIFFFPKYLKLKSTSMKLLLSWGRSLKQNRMSCGYIRSTGCWGRDVEIGYSASLTMIFHLGNCCKTGAKWRV